MMCARKSAEQHGPAGPFFSQPTGWVWLLQQLRLLEWQQPVLRLLGVSGLLHSWAVRALEQVVLVWRACWQRYWAWEFGSPDADQAAGYTLPSRNRASASGQGVWLTIIAHTRPKCVQTVPNLNAHTEMIALFPFTLLR